MTDQELSYWIAKTQGSRHRWTEDEIVRLNGRGAMYYQGGTDGIYLRAHPDGRMEAGVYEEAFPHIGDAFFEVKAERQYKDFNEAFAAVMSLGGKQFLVDMFSQPDYLRSAELDMEQNYNMAPDGLINNIAPPKTDLTDGQTHDELRELAPQTLPEEIQAGDGKPSLLGQVEQYKVDSAASQVTGPVQEPELER